ncbi:NUDIX domain-containing protein [Paracoccus suum]|uniref:NUDIX domain-containing protein n=1 Tax=Paracoccus suum TaxID=2259340 RepID=A0A344PNX2_9RHOB|nr:NUDIX domain-containing protein [Paracoccus suum]
MAPGAPDISIPVRRKKPETQVAALCLNEARDRVLLITSRGTGRWVVPKGWPMRKFSLPGTALQEAWEEAGVEGVVGQTELGRYHYAKLQDQAFAIPIEVRVFAVIVRRLKSRFPEAGERKLKWFRPEEAAPLVAEAGLRDLILSLPELVTSGRLMPKKSDKRRK